MEEKKFEARFNTHLVFKKQDVEDCLNGLEQAVLQMLFEKIVAYRSGSGRIPQPTYLVVNVDEPYADLVMDVIRYGEIHYFPIPRNAIAVKEGE